MLIACPDAQGIVAAVTDFISRHHGNILHLDQHVDEEVSTFFMRVEWELDGFDLARAELPGAFAPIAQRFRMKWDLHFTDVIPRMAILVSTQPHCLYDLLARAQGGEWTVQIPLILSNHDTLAPVAAQFGVRFEHLPITPENKAAQEQRQLELLRDARVDFVVLARYMQILTPTLIDAYPDRIINIHHSFLPAFPGSKPYHSAYARGVKIIGATSHYVTRDLDAGPIIAQDVTHVSHKERVPDLVRKGRDIEKIVLARAVWSHLQHRILVYANKTVVFS